MLPDKVGTGGVNAAHGDYAEGWLAVRFGRIGVSESNNILPHDYGRCQVKVVSVKV